MPVRAPALLRDAGVRGVHALLAVLFVIGSALLVPAAAAHADTVRDQQWQLGFLRARDAWKVSTGKGITVAVIDSGVDANHPDLKGQVLPGADFVDGTTDGRTDFVGHGTTVAALIAGHNDADGVVGLAYDAKILPVRVLDKDNRYESGDVVARAVMWAVDRGVQVINLSLGSAEAAGSLSEAIQYAFQHDVVVVACDGNLSNKRGTLVWHPAREPGVLAVSGVTAQGRFWTGSLQGPATVLAAPAANITGANPGGDYWNVQGTSFASPIVAATAALVRAKYPTMNAPNVVNRLTQTAWDFGVPGRDNEFGFGVVNPARALTANVPAVQKNPLLTSTLVGGRAGRAPGGGPGEPGSPTGTGIPQALASSTGSPWLHQSAFLVGGLCAIFLALAVIAVVMSGGVRVRRADRIMVLAPLASAGDASLTTGSRTYRSRHRKPERSRLGGATADSLPAGDAASQAVPPVAETPAAGERRGGSHRLKRDRRRLWTPAPKQPVEGFEPLPPVEPVEQTATQPQPAPASGEAAVADAPVAEVPVTDVPVTEVPIAEALVVETPGVATPVVETPVVDTPVVETPVVDTPVVDTPVVDTPVVDTPGAETLAVDTPVVDTPAAEALAGDAPAHEDVQATEVPADAVPEAPQATARGKASVPAPAPKAPSDALEGTRESLASWLNAVQDIARQTADAGGPTVDTGFDEPVTLDLAQQANPAPEPDAASSRFRRADADKPEPHGTSENGNGKASKKSDDRFGETAPAKPEATAAPPPAEDFPLPDSFHAFFDDLPRLSDLHPDVSAALANDLDDSSDIGDPETTATAMLKAILEGLKKDRAAATERAAAAPEPELAKHRPSPRPRKPHDDAPIAEASTPQPTAEKHAAEARPTAPPATTAEPEPIEASEAESPADADAAPEPGSKRPRFAGLRAGLQRLRPRRATGEPLDAETSATPEGSVPAE